MSLDFGVLQTTWERRRPAAGGLPRREDLDLRTLQPWLGALMLIDCGSGAAYRVRLHGSRLDELFDRDLTGTEFGGSTGASGHPLESLVRVFDRARQGRPVHRNVELRGRVDRRVEILVLPIAGSGVGADPERAVQLLIALQVATASDSGATAGEQRAPRRGAGGLGGSGLLGVLGMVAR